jgi:hypothetical protein
MCYARTNDDYFTRTGRNLLMTSLQRYGAGKGIVKPGSAAPETSTSDAIFSQKVDSWQEMVYLVDPNNAVEGSPIAGAVDSPAGAVKKFGALFQKKVVWNVTSEKVFIRHLLRPLSRRGDGRYAPSGVWSCDRTEIFAFLTTPKKRSGVLPSGLLRFSTDAEGNITSHTEVAGDDVLHMLPSAVQSTAVSSVPMPTYSHGELVQFANSHGIPYAHDLSYIRHDGNKLFVVTARKEYKGKLVTASVDEAQRRIISEPWTLTQTTGNIKRFTASKEVSKT